MAELTQSEFEMLYLRRSIEDCEFILDTLKADGKITVVPDQDATTKRKKPATGKRKKPATGAKVKRPASSKFPRSNRP